MKQIILLFLLFNIGQVLGQNILQLPFNANPTRKYAKCLIPDSAHRNVLRGSIPPHSWDEYLLEKTPKLQRFKIELPVFDTIILKIPVDKATRMANLPDEYGLINEKIKVNASSFKWVLDKEIAECLSANPNDCFILSIIKVPAEYIIVQKLVVKSTAHQQRFEDRDTIVFKQVIETKPLKRAAFEVAPQYEKVLMKKNPFAIYSEWREILCADGDRSDNTILQLQKALKKRGYYDGELDNVLGKKTKEALKHFQKDKKLEVGTLNLETIKLLIEHDEAED